MDAFLTGVGFALPIAFLVFVFWILPKTIRRLFPKEVPPNQRTGRRQATQEKRVVLWFPAQYDVSIPFTDNPKMLSAVLDELNRNFQSFMNDNLGRVTDDLPRLARDLPAHLTRNLSRSAKELGIGFADLNLATDITPVLQLEPDSAEVIREGSIFLGESEDGNVYLPYADRPQQVYIIGRPGFGKTTFMLNAALQDIENGLGVAVIDPSGDFAKDLLNRIPVTRKNDAIYFDAEDPIPLSLLKPTSPDEEKRLAKDLSIAFRRILGKDWGPNMEVIIEIATQTLLKIPDAHLLQLHDILIDDKRRRLLTQNKVKLPQEIANFWNDVYPDIQKQSKTAVLIRLAQLSASVPLQRFIGVPNAKLSLYDVMQENKIFIANLGKVDEETRKLMGSIITSQIQMIVFRRSRIDPEDRVPYYLYIDEFQDFASSEFKTIFSQARKFKLCLMINHQGLWQFRDTDAALGDAIRSCAGTFVIYNIDSKDTSAFKDYLRAIDPKDLPRLPQYHFVLKNVAGQDNYARAPEPRKVTASYAAEIEKRTIAEYACAAPAERGTPSKDGRPAPVSESSPD